MPVTLPDGRTTTLGIMVCYDLVYDDFAYDTVTHGGQVIVVQSSNAMYQGTGQIEQQFAITRARAMELRREILVVTTSGVSGLINADGIDRLHRTRPRGRLRCRHPAAAHRPHARQPGWPPGSNWRSRCAALVWLAGTISYGRMKQMAPEPERST